MKDNASIPMRPAMNHAMTSSGLPLKKISPDDLYCMNDYTWEHPVAVDLAYARDDNLLFGEQIYKTGAKLWLHKTLAKVVLAAARRVHKETGGVLILYDGLRVTDAQDAMLGTARVRGNPQWLEAPRLLSPPGAGGHPRAMAVDVGIIGADRELLDMGTAFDFLADDPSPVANPAHRDYAHSAAVTANRAILDKAMMGAAEECAIALTALPQEWWDYRLPQDVYEEYAPLSDADLPEHMRLMD